MATVQLNAQDFEKTITDNNLVFVDFRATWCGPCRAFGPTFEAASEENPDIVFGKVDIDANQDTVRQRGRHPGSAHADDREAGPDHLQAGRRAARRRPLTT